MTPRIRNAIVVFLFLAVSVTIAVSIDYTDTYVADRFHRTLASQQYAPGENVSLDRYIEYYEWDRVYVVLPGEEPPALSTQLGMAYKHRPKNGESWSLIFVKSDYVVAEIPIERSELEYPQGELQEYYNRWSTIIAVMNDNGTKCMEFVGE